MSVPLEVSSPAGYLPNKVQQKVQGMHCPGTFISTQPTAPLAYGEDLQDAIGQDPALPTCH